LTNQASLLTDAKCLVIKVGSSLVTNNGEGLDQAAIAAWAEQIAQLVRPVDGIEARQVVLVSSGAVAEGMQRLGWKKRPTAVNELQAAAAVGQMGLVQMYESCFSQHGLHTAQVLLTHDDLADRKRYLNARSTLRTLLAMGVIPIINENDSVAVAEIKVGDNDKLSADVTQFLVYQVSILAYALGQLIFICFGFAFGCYSFVIFQCKMPLTDVGFNILFWYTDIVCVFQFYF
jgi:glutamate 5-kinase